MNYSAHLITDDPIGSIYKFMTEPTLHNPEVTLLSDTESFYTKSDLPGEDIFRKEASGAVLMAVASFDKADVRRVNLAVINGMAVVSVYDKGDLEARDALAEELV